MAVSGCRFSAEASRSPCQTLSKSAPSPLCFDAGEVQSKIAPTSAVSSANRRLSRITHTLFVEVLNGLQQIRVLIIVDSWGRAEKERNLRKGIDLASTLQRIEKNFVITDPRLPDKPIIFASDSFLELKSIQEKEFWEEIVGYNLIKHHVEVDLMHI
ncbi:hypothetical protein Cgig2_018536 [Carnegiea gigantea]|uniref:Uncharacterized protein n=1 Tax=Carnegiea gigantea TaxID=171969 RepID=A0A9Q1KL30_9CARY|nr:hypothetical protein Cgig2_018536 [Carnegiea gigantea]